MTSDPIWRPLHEEFARRKLSGRMTDFWLRDDDAVEPTPALDRLLALTGRFSIPATLAAIPAWTAEPLAARLARESRVEVGVHGWSHANHAPDGEKKQELGAHRRRAVVLDELERGLAHITRLHGDRAVPLLVPPWNRIEPDLVPLLGGIGFSALSTFGPAKPAAIRVINANVDLIDWHGTRGCRDHAVLVREIIAQLEREDGVVGLLTHHLVHDEAAWRFLGQLFEVTSRHECCRWRSVTEMLDLDALGGP
jgi:peptidoglycan/xylan/chitin deacetylase (PgdA/CDA1 family)